MAEVEAEHAGSDTVRFTDRLLCLVARKPDSSDSESVGDSRSGAGCESGAASPAARVPSPGLTLGQREQYVEQGFTGPLDILSAEEAAAACEQYERYGQLCGGAVGGDWRFKSHLLLPWVWRLAHHPRLLAAVSDALGGCRNLLCWSTDWFHKQPGDGGFTSWHQARVLWAPGPGALVAVGGLTVLDSSSPWQLALDPFGGIAFRQRCLCHPCEATTHPPAGQHIRGAVAP